MDKRPYLSIVIPIHDMANGDKFLWKLVNSITEQTFKDWEIIITKDGKMAENTNSAIKRARGKLIKIIYLDDYLSNSNCLKTIVDKFTDDLDWMIVGANNNEYPYWTDDCHKGVNKLGSPSALVLRNHGNDTLLFDENLSWLLDGDLYRRLHEKYGRPAILYGNYITIGEGPHQMTNIMSEEYKLSEHKYIEKKYE